MPCDVFVQWRSPTAATRTILRSAFFMASPLPRGTRVIACMVRKNHAWTVTRHPFA